MKRGNFILIFLILFITLLLANVVTSLDSEGTLSEWRMFGRWLNHTRWDGVSFSKISGLNKAYFQTGRDIVSAPAIANRYVYFTSSDNYTYQLNASNVSQQISSFLSGNGAYTGTGIFTSPAVANGYVYIGSNNNYTYQLNASDISIQIANFSTGNEIYTSPAIANISGKLYLYVGSTDHIFYQLNASNVSQQIANFTTNNRIDSSPAVANEYVYLGSSDGYIYQLNASNVSQQIAKFHVSGAVGAPSPAVANGYVYIGDGLGKMYQLNASNISVQVAENYISGTSTEGSPAVANGYVYIGTNDWVFHQLNASNISIGVATFTATQAVFSSPAVAYGYAYVGSDNGYLYQLNASDISQLKAKFRAGGSVAGSPSVANGYVYFGANDDRLWQLNASLNNAPTSSDILINPVPAYSNNTMNGNFTIYDLDIAEKINVSANWFNGTVLYSGCTWSNQLNGTQLNCTLPNGILHRDEVWNFSIDLFDGIDNFTNSSTITIIDNLPPDIYSSLKNYLSLQPCLQDINGSSNNCTINISNYQETFNISRRYDSLLTEGIFISSTGNLTNIYIDFNTSYLMGSAVGFGLNISSRNSENWTIKNLKVDNFGRNLELSSNNLTLVNITSINAQVTNGIRIGDVSSNNYILRDITVLNSAAEGINIDSNAVNANLSNVNSSDNVGKNLLISGDNVDVRNSFFYNSSSDYSIYTTKNNLIFINNSVKYNYVNDKTGLFLWGNNHTIINNIFGENNINLLLLNVRNSTIQNNIFNVSYDNDAGGIGFGVNVIFNGASNNNFTNNTIESSIDVGILFSSLLAAGNSNNNNLIGNIFKNTTTITHQYDLWLYGTTIINTSLSLNSFYANMSDRGSMTNYCINSEGNFYNESIEKTTINETDCGIVNITQPDGLNKVITNPYNIQWRKQSSIYPINYTLWYRSANTSTWTFLSSTTTNIYSWNTASFNESNDYIIKIVPNDGYMNGTNDNSTYTFTVDNANPTIVLTPSADTSMDLGASKTLTCTGTDNFGMSSTSLTVAGSSEGMSCGTSSCTGSYRMATSDSKTVLCTITDNSGRTNSKSIILSLFGEGGTLGNGGDSGGGSDNEENEVTGSNITETAKALNEKFSFVFEGKTYEGIITEINSDSMKADIDGKELKLNIGESKEIDLNNDNKNDIIITLNGIKDKKAELSIKLKQTEKQEEVADKSSTYKIILIAAAVILIIGIIIYIFKRKNIGKPPHKRR